MVKFSIIVPVYNVEKYLSKCIESILAQSFQDYELLLVNDGSTDQSGRLCDMYALLQNKICVIHKKNGGLSDARNTGMAKAKGEYIIFVDSDDYIELETLDKFNKELEESDNPHVMITLIKQVYEDKNSKYMDENMPLHLKKNCNKNEVVEWIFIKSNNTWPCIRYIVRRDFIENQDMKFLSGYLHEDIDWTTQLFLNAETFTYLNFFWYNHRMGREGSITTSNNAKRTLDVIKLVSKNINDSNYLKVNANIRVAFFRRLVSSLYSSLRQYNNASKEDKKNIVFALKQNCHVLKYSNTLKHNVFLLVSKVFGFRFSLFIYGIIYS